MADLGPPPWSPTAEEQQMLDHTAFQHCEAVLQAFASRANGRISNEIYTFSRQWGNILRAKVTFIARGSTATSLLTCWSDAEGGVKMALTMDEPQAGA